MELDFPLFKPWILSCSGGLHWIDWNCRFSSEQSQTDWPNNTILFQPNSTDGSLRSSVSHSLLCVFLLSIPPQLPVIHARNYQYMQMRTSIHYQWDRDPKTIHYLIHSRWAIRRHQLDVTWARNKLYGQRREFNTSTTSLDCALFSILLVPHTKPAEVMPIQ